MTFGPRTHSIRLAAWLGLIAMCMLAAAPTISWLASASSRAVILPVCTYAEQAGQPSADDRIQIGAHDGLTSALEACAYCNLLADHSTLPAMPPAAPALLLLALGALIALRWVHRVPRGTFPSGRPRDPPSFS